MNGPAGQTNPDGGIVAGAGASGAEPPAARWYRTWKLVWVVGVIVLLVVVGAIVAVKTNSTHQTPASSPEKEAVVSWWARARDDFSTLQSAVDQTQRALDQLDETNLKAGCQLLHDTAEVSLEAKMPTPDPELTAEVRSMIEDFHAASHMCLSAAAGSLNNYSGEFQSYLEQARNQMLAAQDKITTLTRA